MKKIKVGMEAKNVNLKKVEKEEEKKQLRHGIHGILSVIAGIALLVLWLLLPFSAPIALDAAIIIASVLLFFKGAWHLIRDIIESRKPTES